MLASSPGEIIREREGVVDDVGGTKGIVSGKHPRPLQENVRRTIDQIRRDVDTELRRARLGADGEVLVVVVALRGEARLIEQRRREGVRISDVAEVGRDVVRYRVAADRRCAGGAGIGHRTGRILLGQGHAEHIARADRVIDLAHVLRVVGLGRRLREHIARRRGRNQILLEVIERDRTDAGRRDDALRGQRGIRLEVGIGLQERHHRRIGTAVHRLREVALRLQRGIGGHLARRRIGTLFLAFVAEEEEELVAAVDDVRQHDRTAQRRTVLIALEDLPRNALLVVEKRVGVEVLIANVVESRGVHRISAALGDHAHHAAAVAAVLGRVVTLQHAEFGHCIGIRIDHHIVVDQMVVVAAVKQVGDRIGAHAADRIGARLARSVAVLGGRAGLRSQQVERVAPIERQLENGIAVDRGTHGRVLGLHGAGTAFNRDRVLGVAHFELQVDTQSLVDDGF